MAEPSPVGRAVLTFALLGVLAAIVVGVGGALVLRRLATDQALTQARDFTAFSARVVERRVTDGLVAGDAEAAVAVASVVGDAVLHPPVVRVKIWTEDGEIVYSDETRLIGERYELGDDELEALEHGGVTAAVSDLSEPENRFERGQGELLEVYTSIHTPDGTPLLFETYQRSESVSSSGRELALTFAPVLGIALVAFLAVVIPLAWALARRLARAQRDRERLLQRSADISDRERRRIARDLHDGPVQDLAGLSMTLSAAAERTDDVAVRQTLRDAATATRTSIGTLRSAVVGVYPPSLQRSGLEAALNDLTAALRRDGVGVTVDVSSDARFGERVDETVYRVAREALRNVATHASATTVRVSVGRDGGRAILEIADDGRGLDPAEMEEARGDGHLGLQILRDLVDDAEGALSVSSPPAGGVLVHAEVPE
jgi:signal transduction histidine kinase